MNDLQIFNYESNEVRTVMINGAPWFCLVDVCKVLGLAEPHRVATRIDEDERTQMTVTDSMGRKQKTWFINESGLYTVILRSDKPEAKPFRKWVTGTVLPAIRKTGSYRSNALPDPKASIAEAKLNNSRARLASVWLKLANINPLPEYRQICASHASAVLAGREVIPLPEAKERTYSAEEVGAMLGGMSANKVGRIANQNGLKTPEYGLEVWDKSKHSTKQVPSWRYNARAVERFREIIGGAAE